MTTVSPRSSKFQVRFGVQKKFLCRILRLFVLCLGLLWPMHSILSLYALSGTPNLTHKLRFDWTNLTLSTEYSQVIERHQTDCTLPVADFRFRNRFGMGSDLHVWTQAMCNALEAGYRIRTELPWIYMSTNYCKMNSLSAMNCYFPRAELQCSGDAQEIIRTSSTDESRHKLYRGKGRLSFACPKTMVKFNLTLQDIRAASVEFLFSHVSTLVQREAERQLNEVFASLESVPNDLITVHIRWGDKADEMEIVEINEYVDAVHRILSVRRESRPTSEQDPPAHIFLSTEDPAAVAAFTRAAPTEWNIYVDQYFHDFLNNRYTGYNNNPRMAEVLQGDPGLKALGSLLVAMEANDFVLTTSSNWSRLMNELRKTILEARCHGCTSMIDLRGGSW